MNESDGADLSRWITNVGGLTIQMHVPPQILPAQMHIVDCKWKNINIINLLYIGCGFYLYFLNDGLITVSRNAQVLITRTQALMKF